MGDQDLAVIKDLLLNDPRKPDNGNSPDHWSLLETLKLLIPSGCRNHDGRQE